MIKIDIDYNDELLQRKLKRFPAMLERATKSSLASVGWKIRGELRTYIESGYVEGPNLHPFTLGFKGKNITQKTKNPGGYKRLFAKRRNHPGPLYWMGKFARYESPYGTTDNMVVKIGLGRTQKGEPVRSFDKMLESWTRKHEQGKTIPVSPKMQHFLAAYGFPVKPGGSLIIPKRPTISVIRKKVQPKVQGWFQEKFIERLRKYQMEGIIESGAA